MATIRQDRLKHLLEKLEPVHGRMHLVAGDALEQVLWMILARHGSDARAGKAIAAIRAFFSDLNELRVAKATDLAEVIAPHVSGDTVGIALKLRGFLRKAFDDKNVLGFEFAKTMDRDAIRKYLSTLPDFGPELQLGVLLKLRADEKELVADPTATRVAIRTGLVPAGTGPARLKKAFEEEAPEGDLAIRGLLTLACHGGAVCHSKGPACGECALGSWCPSFTAPKRKEAPEAAAKGDRRGGEQATPRTQRARAKPSNGKKSSRR